MVTVTVSAGATYRLDCTWYQPGETVSVSGIMAATGRRMGVFD